MNRFYAKEKIGNTRYLTDEGFLLCKDVTIARVGDLVYLPEEVPKLEPMNGKVIMERPEAALFNDETIASFNGKPVLNGFHKYVDPDNYKELTVGNIQNVRRGNDDMSGFLVGDLLIMDAQAIDSVNKGRTEISIGYDSVYRQIEPGRGEQTKVTGNHVALVDEGRAGPTCMIGDEKPKEGVVVDKEASSVDLGLLAKLIDLLGMGKGKITELAGDIDPQDETVALGARLAKLERVLAKLIPLEEIEHGISFTDEMKKAIADCSTPAGADALPEKDASKTEEVIVGDELEAEEVIERAEILSPGIDVPKGDSATVIPSIMIASLMDAIKIKGTPGDTARSILGKFADKLPDAPRVLLNAAFIAASDVAKSVNNGVGRMVFSDISSKYVAPRSGADLQEIYNKANGGGK